MATENQQTMLEEIASEAPSEHEVFAGDEDFYKQLEYSTQPFTAKPRRVKDILSRPTIQSIYLHLKRFSTAQKIIAGAIAIIAVMLLYALIKSPPSPRKRSKPMPAPLDWTTHAVDAEQQILQQIQKPGAILPSTQSMSLQAAENFYLQADYVKAYTTYKGLHQNLPASPQAELLKDFIQLKMALCIKKAGPNLQKDQAHSAADQAHQLLKTALKSNSPVVRVVAGYHLIFIDIQKKQYLQALARAYQTIALIDAVDFNKDVVSSLECDCHFLAAEAITRNVLSLCDADKDLPGDLWSAGSDFDPFINLNEEQLQALLNSGSEQLNKALLSPQIHKLDHQGTHSRWFVTSHSAPAEELLTRFAANAGLDIQWTHDRELPPKAENTARIKPVSLHMPTVTTQQFVTAAAGCAGLLALLQDSGIVNIFDPTDSNSLSDHVDLLSQQAISLWRQFLLTFYEDNRIPNAHFALGLLESQKGRLAESIAEYKFVANRFSRSALAPYALLHSSKLKADLNDYYGASEDLKQLVEQYPDAEIASQSYLHLADATMKAQLYDEAGRLYRKIYNLDLSVEAQTTSALGAARCFYERKDYENAAKWLTRYISLATESPSSNLYSAYSLLGKSYLALKKPKQACDAFQYALSGGLKWLSREAYAQTLSVLVKTYMEQEQLVEALDALKNVPPSAFSQQDSIEILLLRSKIFRALDLLDKAIATIGDQAEYISDPVLKAKLSFELANCQIAKGNLELARKSLTEILIFAEAGPLAHEIALKLADVCLKLNQNSQTISICSQLLDLDTSPQIKQKTLELLSAAYKRQKNYDKAALALLGRWNDVENQ